jgi:exopolysaccharide production protein ExoZ
MLRGIAATMVLFVHMDNQLTRLKYGAFGTDWMTTGVDIFFVISGFIMWTSVERRGGMSAGVFFKNRIIRIVPLYWFVTTIVLLVGLIIPQVLTTTRLEPVHALASYLFLPARHPVARVFWPLLVPGWSLNYEMLFYVVFAIAISLSGQSRRLRFGLIAGALGALLLIASLTRSRLDVMNFYANPVLLEFVAGILLGIIWRTGLVRRSLLWLPVVLVGFILLWPGLRLNGGFPVTLIAATMIVGGAIFLPPIPHNPVSSVGDASYSLYLTHTITLSALGLVWAQVFEPLGWQLFVLAGITAAIAVAFVVYICFERPVTVALKRVSFARRDGAIVARAPATADTQK